MTATTLSSLSLFAASPEQTLESRRRSFVEWGKNLTVDEYLARDDFTDKTEVARDGKLITWVLAPRNDSTSLDFLCSCETFRREGLVCSQSDLDAKPKNVTCYGIATVFTPLRFRGNGYGKHMMRLLHWVLADTSLLPLSFPSEWGTPPPRVPLAGDGWFSALWSDVGEDFYMRCGPTKDQDGWIVRAPFSTTWTVGKESSGLDTHDDEWTLLDEAGVLKLWENDADNIARSVSLADNYQAAFTFLASQGVAAFQYRRNMDVLAKYFPPPIQHWGIIADPDTFATWTFEVRSPPKTLLITRLSCSPLDFDTLLGRIMTIAGKHGLQQVEVYNLPGDLQSAALRLGGSTKEREEHLSAFKWYGPEDQSQVAWLLNER